MGLRRWDLWHGHLMSTHIRACSQGFLHSPHPHPQAGMFHVCCRENSRAAVTSFRAMRHNLGLQWLSLGHNLSHFLTSLLLSPHFLCGWLLRICLLLFCWLWICFFYKNHAFLSTEVTECHNTLFHSFSFSFSSRILAQAKPHDLSLEIVHMANFDPWALFCPVSVSHKVASWNRFQGSDFTFMVLWLSCKTETLCLISNLLTPPSATPSDPNSVSSSLTPLYNTYAWNCMALSYYHGLISNGLIISPCIRISSLKSLGDYIFIKYKYIL